MSKEAIFVQDGDRINYIAGADIAAGQVIPLVNRVGIAMTGIANGSTGAVKLTGVWNMPAVNDTAFAVGDKLYWDDTANKLTKTATSNTYAGECVNVKGTTETTAYVRIDK